LFSVLVFWAFLTSVGQKQHLLTAANWSFFYGWVHLIKANQAINN
jgi:hypothetical protein